MSVYASAGNYQTELDELELGARVSMKLDEEGLYKASGVIFWWNLDLEQRKACGLL